MTQFLRRYVRNLKRPSVLILGTLVLVLLVYAIVGRSPTVAWEGLRGGAKLFLEILPNLVLGFLLAGLAQEVVPRDWVVKYAGEDSGLSGYLVATCLGACTPGGPFLQFPLVAGLWKAGAGVGQITSYISAWALMGFQRIIVYEVPMMGWRYASARYLSNLVAPPLLGFLTSWVFRVLYGGRPA